MKAKPKRISLRKHEWSFHLVQKEQIPAAALWERMRHQGQLHFACPRPYDLSKPWLDLSKQDQLYLQGQLYPAFFEIPPTPQVLKLIQEPENERVHWRVFIINLTLAATEMELVERFRAWLVAKRRRHKKAVRLPDEPERFPANRPPFKTWLMDIACWRADKSGLGREAAKELLKPLIVAWGYNGATEGRFSAKHWREMLKRAEHLKSH